MFCEGVHVNVSCFRAIEKSSTKMRGFATNQVRYNLENTAVILQEKMVPGLSFSPLKGKESRGKIVK